MRVILCGQKAFGVAVLNSITTEAVAEVSLVVAPAGDKLAARAHHYGVSVASRLEAGQIPEGTDLIIAAHSHDFISGKARLKAKYGAIGYHPSLLPVHRGRDAVAWTIRDRDRFSGGSVYWLSDVVDGGPVAAQEFCFVRPDDTASTLWRRELFPLGVALINRVVRQVAGGVLVQVDQDNALVTWEPAITGVPRLYRPDLPQIPYEYDGVLIDKRPTSLRGLLNAA